MSTSAQKLGESKKRGYRLGKRAEKQAETRQRIVEAAVALHGTLGPARTPAARIAELAGVQRHTFYAHFPDDRSLWLACSGHAMARDPLPEVERWTAFAPGAERIRNGLEQLYRWYERNEQLTACVLRDSEVHDLTREVADLRMGPTFARASALLGQGLDERSRALVAIALDFHCWRALARSQDAAGAAALMAAAVSGLEREKSTRP
jgi:AcrR family transcriptional regulator